MKSGSENPYVGGGAKSGPERFKGAAKTAPRKVLILHGEVNNDVMRHERITPADLQAALRAGGCLHTHEVARATVETNGQITIVPKAEPYPRTD